MQKSCIDSVLEELQRIEKQIISKEKSILRQILNLEQLLNNSLSTNIVRQKPNDASKKEEQQTKKQFNVERVALKIEEIIGDTEQIDVNQPVKVIKEAIKAPKEAPKVEKKPSVPTVNRSSAVDRNQVIPKYVPPRNKNEVTGKVTQNRIMTQNKTFKPQLNKAASTKPQGCRANSTAISHSSKREFSQEKAGSTNSRSGVQSRDSTNAANRFDIDKNAVSEYKDLRNKDKIVQMSQFAKDPQQLCEEVLQNKERKSKQINIKPLMESYQKEQMGHRTAEDKKKGQFLKKFAQYSYNKNHSLIPQITSSIQKRSWQQYPYIFGFNDLLEDLEARIAVLEENQANDLRLDPKQVFRVQVMKDILGDELQKIIESTEIEVPEKLDLSVKGRNSQSPMDGTIETLNNRDPTDYTPFYEKLQELLEDIQNQDDLSTRKIAQIRMLIEILKFRGRRSPLVVLTEQFDDWAEFYQESQ